MTEAGLGWVSDFPAKLLLPSSANVLGSCNHSNDPSETKHHEYYRVLRTSSLEKVVMCTTISLPGPHFADWETKHERKNPTF